MFRLAALGLVLAGSLSALPAGAETVDLYGRQVELFLPEGYCLLDSAQPNEQALIDYMTQLNQGSSHLIAYFAPCNELTAFRVGAQDSMTEYGLLFAPLVNGAFQPAAQGRAATLAELAAAIPQVDEAMLREIEQQSQASQSGLQLSGMQFLGLLAQDENALYAGLLMNVGDGQSSIAVAGVVAMTVLADVTLTANLYRPYRSNADIVALASELTPYMAGLTAANP